MQFTNLCFFVPLLLVILSFYVIFLFMFLNIQCLTISFFLSHSSTLSFVSNFLSPSSTLPLTLSFYVFNYFLNHFFILLLSYLFPLSMCSLIFALYFLFQFFSFFFRMFFLLILFPLSFSHPDVCDASINRGSRKLILNFREILLTENLIWYNLAVNVF